MLDLTMAPPQPMQCSSGSCEYETPVNIPTYELVIKALELHVQSVHTRNNASHGQSKVEKPKRPTVSTGFSESDWQFLSTSGKDIQDKLRFKNVNLQLNCGHVWTMSWKSRI